MYLYVYYKNLGVFFFEIGQKPQNDKARFAPFDSILAQTLKRLFYIVLNQYLI
jgi:hypothetical protein